MPDFKMNPAKPIKNLGGVVVVDQSDKSSMKHKTNNVISIQKETGTPIK